MNHLTDAQLDLYDRISEISEDCFCASWIVDNEYNIWNAIVNSDEHPVNQWMNSRLLRGCKLLTKDVGGRIYWTGDKRNTTSHTYNAAKAAAVAAIHRALPTKPNSSLPSYKPGALLMLDITSAQQEQIQHLLHLRLPHTTALAFGSRVVAWPFGRGAKPYSDLDIALFGLAQADAQALAHLRADLEESPPPWRVDIGDAIDLPPALRELVEQRGGMVQGKPVLQSSRA